MPVRSDEFRVRWGSAAQRQGAIPRVGWLRLGVAILMIGWPALGAAPYYDLRARPLDYMGLDVVSTNQALLCWFGPTNDPSGAVDPNWWAACLAVREVNDDRGGTNLPFSLLPCWTADPWGSGVTLLTRTIFELQPIAVIGSVDSASTHLAEQVVAKANLPLLSYCTTDPSLTLAGVPWMFSCLPSDTAVARVLSGELLRALTNAPAGSRRSWMMLSTTDHGSRMSARALLREFSQRGHLPDSKYEIDPRRPGHDEQVEALRAGQPDVILIVADSELSARLADEVAAVCPHATLYGTHTLGRRLQVDTGGKGGARVVFPLLLAPADPERWTRFRSAFKAAHNYEPDYAAAAAYDAVRLITEQIRCVGPSRVRVRQALAESGAWDGVSGTIRFDGTGQNTRCDLRFSVAGWVPATR